MSDADAKTKDDAKAEAQEAASSADSASVETPATKEQLKEVEVAENGEENGNSDSKPPKDKLKLKVLGIRIAALIVFLGITGAAIYFLRDGVEVEAEIEEPETFDSGLRLDPSLNARELIRFGTEALHNSDTREASRFFEGARLRANLESPNDINLTVEIYEGLAKIEDARGNTGPAAMLREYVVSLQESLGESLSIFNAAEKQFRESNHMEARKLYARFLLTSDSLEEGGKRYIDSAKRRMAESYVREHNERYLKKTPESLMSPMEFFHER